MLYIMQQFLRSIASIGIVVPHKSITGPLHEQACACRPFTNDRAAWRLPAFWVALQLFKGLQAQAKLVCVEGP